jgi:hypothetical protein
MLKFEMSRKPYKTRSSKFSSGARWNNDSFEAKIFPVGVVEKMFGFTKNDFKKIRKEIDPEGLGSREIFSHNKVFAYCILLTLYKIRKLDIDALASFNNWKDIFRICQRSKLNEIRKSFLAIDYLSDRIFILDESIVSGIERGEISTIPLEKVYSVYVDVTASKFVSEEDEDKDLSIEQILREEQEELSTFLNTPIPINRPPKKKSILELARS